MSLLMKGPTYTSPVPCIRPATSRAHSRETEVVMGVSRRTLWVSLGVGVLVAWNNLRVSYPPGPSTMKNR